MGLDNINLKMKANILVIGKIIKWKEKENFFLARIIYNMMDNGKTINMMDGVVFTVIKMLKILG
jgi:hypothetical protein